MPASFTYTGSDNLEAMQGAHHYNAYLLGIVLTEIDALGTGTPRVLDFGAGIGTFAAMVRAARPHVEITCLEPSAPEAAKVRELGFDLLGDDEDAEFDLVYSFNVLEHIERDDDALRTAASLLADGGTAVVYVPAFNLLFSEMDRLVEHHRRYRARDFRRLSRAAGLELRQVRYCDPIGFFAALAYRLARGDGRLRPGSVAIFDRFLFPTSAWLERFTRRFFGKNVLAVMARPDRTPRAGR